MVLCYNGHGHRLDFTSQSPLQRNMAILGFRRNLRPECASLPPFPIHLHPSIHHLPGNLVRNDQAPRSIALPWDFSHGFSNDREHDRLRLRASLGPVGRDFGQLWR